MEHQLTEEDIIFCDKAEKLLFTAMKTNFPTSADGKEEHLILVPPRNNPFLHKIITSSIHETRYATTDMYHVLGVNVDSQNPNIHDLLSYSFMNQPVGWFAKRRCKIRRLLVDFGRYSVVNTAMCYNKFGPCLESITMIYINLPDDKF